MRRCYSLLLYLAMPVILLRLLWRSRQAPAYRRRWAERFGLFPALPQAGCIWVHAVSLGETRAALPLIRALQERYRSIPLLVTTLTPTGSQQVRDSLGNRVHHVYLPYDWPDAVQRFLARAKPRLAIIMETELWPNLLHACAQSGVPVLLANARLSERSARRYARFPTLTRQMLACVTLIAAQARADAVRFNELGATAEHLRVTGNIKYDLTLPAGLSAQGRELRRALFGRRPVWIAASTHAGEDEQLLVAHAQLRARFPNLLLLLVPRHPERFAPVAELCRQRGLHFVKRSERRACLATTEIFLGDSVGELLLFYAAADVAFVGGSLVPRGGHNVLEPALLGLPVLFGPHMFNFTGASEQLLHAEGAWQIDNAQALAAQLARLLSDDNLRRSAGQRNKAAVEANRGALAQLFALVEDLLEAQKASRTQRLSKQRANQAGSEQRH